MNDVYLFELHVLGGRPSRALYTANCIARLFCNLTKVIFRLVKLLEWLNALRLKFAYRGEIYKQAELSKLLGRIVDSVSS